MLKSVKEQLAMQPLVVICVIYMENIKHPKTKLKCLAYYPT